MSIEHATGDDRHPCHMHAYRERCGECECECVAFRTAGDERGCERCGSADCIGRNFPDRCAARLDLGSNFRHPADVAMDICEGLWGPEGS